MPSAFKRRALAVLLLVLLTLIGCGGQRPTYQVQGKVLCDNKPAVGAVVTFHRTDGDTSILPNGVVKGDGTFELTTYALGDGIPAGEYRVVVMWERKTGKKTGGGDDDDPGIHLLPPRYYKPETSGLTAAVTPTTTTLEPFILTK
jgi:hypothetical protein